MHSCAVRSLNHWLNGILARRKSEADTWRLWKQHSSKHRALIRIPPISAPIGREKTSPLTFRCLRQDRKLLEDMRRTHKLLVAASRSSDTHSDESGDRLTDRPLSFFLKEVIYINNWDEKNRKKTDGKKEKLCDGLDDREEYFDRRGDAMFLMIRMWHTQLMFNPAPLWMLRIPVYIMADARVSNAIVVRSGVGPTYTRPENSIPIGSTRTWSTSSLGLVLPCRCSLEASLGCMYGGIARYNSAPTAAARMSGTHHT